MLAKTTLRIPQPLMSKLRERSREEGRSLNETAVTAIEKGLGEETAGEGWRVLGSLVEQPSTRCFRRADFEPLWERLGAAGHGILQDLDWARGDREES
jgi:hypothetical protein